MDRRKSRYLTGSIVAALVGSFGIVQVTHAEEPSPGPSGEANYRVVSEAEASEATKYWTPERMLSAMSADGSTSDIISGNVPEAHQTAENPPGVVKTTNAERTTVGKLFFLTTALTGRRLEVRCTGVSVQAENQSTVLTGAQCIYFRRA